MAYTRLSHMRLTPAFATKASRRANTSGIFFAWSRTAPYLGSFTKALVLPLASRRSDIEVGGALDLHSHCNETILREHSRKASLVLVSGCTMSLFCSYCFRILQPPTATSGTHTLPCSKYYISLTQPPAISSGLVAKEHEIWRLFFPLTVLISIGACTSMHTTPSSVLSVLLLFKHVT